MHARSYMQFLAAKQEQAGKTRLLLFKGRLL